MDTLLNASGFLVAAVIQVIHITGDVTEAISTYFNVPFLLGAEASVTVRTPGKVVQVTARAMDTLLNASGFLVAEGLKKEST